MTTTAGVRALKNSLSHYLRLVRAGESVVVLDRGRAVAVLSAVPENGAGLSTAEHLASLAARGLITLGTGSKQPSRKRPRVDLAGAVADERKESQRLQFVGA